MELTLGRKAEWCCAEAPQTYSTCNTMREITPEMEQMKHHLHMLRMYFWALGQTQRNHKLLHFSIGTARVFHHGLVTCSWCGERSHDFCHTAPSKVWSAPIHVNQSIFGMLAVKWCGPAAAAGWAGRWRRIVSLSSGTPSQGALNWGSHVSTCTFTCVYTQTSCNNCDIRGWHFIRYIHSSAW